MNTLVLSAKLRAECLKLFYLLLALFLYSLALNLFLVGNDIAAGGFVGLATVLHTFIPSPIGTMMFVMNIPLLVLSLKSKGIPFTVKTILAVFVYSFALNVLTFLPTVTHNKLIASAAGGLIYGAGVVFAVKSDSSVGGTDLINRLLVMKFKETSIGKMLLIVDGLVVVLAVITFREVAAGLYAILTLYICAKAADWGLARTGYAGPQMTKTKEGVD
jgi:uncharacterized membrane-anchored protein YitT (DUF2179 family)